MNKVMVVRCLQQNGLHLEICQPFPPHTGVDAQSAKSLCQINMHAENQFYYKAYQLTSNPRGNALLETLRIGKAIVKSFISF